MAGIRANVSAGLIGQIVASVTVMLMLPMYVKYMGAEAFGLVGFYVMAQAWFQLLDLGLSPLLTRYVARFRGGAFSAGELTGGVRAIMVVAAGIAILGALGMATLSPFIARHWLQSVELGAQEVQLSVLLMAPIFAVRFMSSLLRSAMSGFEQFVVLAWLNVAAATLRFVCVLLVFRWWGTGPGEFFWYQLAVALFEFSVLLVLVLKLLPAAAEKSGGRRLLRANPVISELGFAAGASFTAMLWVVATQLDKMLLSSILPLDQYGYYTLCIAAANGILLLSGPVGAVVLPRLTSLLAEHRMLEYRKIYYQGTQMAMVLTAPAVVVLALFPREVLAVWTASHALPDVVHFTMLLYAVGTGFAVASSFQYLLQISHGNVRLHVVGNLVFVAVLVPALYVLAPSMGMVGAAWVWLACNAAMCLFWTPIVHARYLPGHHWAWLAGSVLRICVPTLGVGLALKVLLNWPQDRMLAGLQIAGIAAVLMLIATLSSAEGWRLASRWGRVAR